MAKPKGEILELDGILVTISNPEKVYFPKAGITKRELVDYYLAVADGALRGVARRPMNLKRFVNGVEAKSVDYNFHQWEVRLPGVQPGPLTLTAYGEDEAGNVERMPHRVSVRVK